MGIELLSARGAGEFLKVGYAGCSSRVQMLIRLAQRHGVRFSPPMSREIKRKRPRSRHALYEGCGELRLIRARS
eukprot:2075286-Rhodomonas_salina.5